MYGRDEEEEVSGFIDTLGLKPRILLNTHCHIDHVLGNKYIADRYHILPQFHEGELPLLIEVQNYASQMGFRYEVSPIAETFLPDSGELRFGDNALKIISAPGHSPAHLCFYHQGQGFLIGGDVLFSGSIGRTDLPGGDHQQLMRSIRDSIYTLPSETVVYPGHGPTTTIGFEKEHNPFIRG